MPDAKTGSAFIGVAELFSILLPGAVIAAILAALIATWTDAQLPSPLEGEAPGWVAFALLSYILGHFVFRVASILDGWFYDKYRRNKWPDAADCAYQAATAIRHKVLGTTPPAGPPGSSVGRAGDVPMNTLAWAKNRP